MNSSKQLSAGLLFVILLIAFPYTIEAQDIHFSQFRETPIIINPSLVGINAENNVVLNYRRQWANVSSPYKTMALSGEYVLYRRGKNNQLATGLQLVSDKAGTINMSTQLLMVSLSDKVRITKNHYLSIGVCGGVGQKSLDYSKATWGAQYSNGAFDANQPSGENVQSNFWFPDLGAGMTWSFQQSENTITSNDVKRVCIGLSAFHFSLPAYSFSNNTSERLTTRINVNAQAMYGIQNTNLILLPEILYSRQGVQHELIFGTLFRFVTQNHSRYTGYYQVKSLSAGIHYRFNDALIFTGIYEFKICNISLSYDVNVSAFSATTKYRGGFELAFHFKLPNKGSPYSKKSFD